MKRAEPRDAANRESLLHLWMGAAEEPPPPRRSLPSAPALAVLGLAAAIVVALLAKYAIDALAILLALSAVGLVLHFLGMRLAESDILSPGWFLIIVLGAALVAYALFVPANSVAGLNRYMPKWALAALEWSESRGWAQRAFVGPGGGGTAPSPLGAGAGVAPSSATAAGSASTTPANTGTGGTGAPSVMLSASATSVLQGQPITLMARLPGGSASSPTSVRFYDGLAVLGTADVKAEGRARIAYLTVRGLSVGRHEIRAEMVGTLGIGSGRSEPLRLTVLRRAQ